MENGPDLLLVLVFVFFFFPAVIFSRSYLPRWNCMLTLAFRVNEKNDVGSHTLVNYSIVAKNEIKIDLCVWFHRLIFENKS